MVTKEYTIDQMWSADPLPDEIIQSAALTVCDQMYSKNPDWGSAKGTSREFLDMLGITEDEETGDLIVLNPTVPGHCHRCHSPMVRSGHNARGGMVVHRARGLCTECYRVLFRNARHTKYQKTTEYPETTEVA